MFKYNSCERFKISNTEKKTIFSFLRFLCNCIMARHLIKQKYIVVEVFLTALLFSLVLDFWIPLPLPKERGKTYLMPIDLQLLSYMTDLRCFGKFLLSLQPVIVFFCYFPLNKKCFVPFTVCLKVINYISLIMSITARTSQKAICILPLKHLMPGKTVPV